MRALLRDSKSGRFYAPGWQWTARREEACNFGGTFQALTFAEVNGLLGVEVVLTFENFGSDVTIGLETLVGGSARTGASDKTKQ